LKWIAVVTSNTRRIRIKRIYEAADPNDGTRILVDRLWPRGVKKADARVDKWAGDVAPTTELRTWFNREPSRFDEFRLRYWQELEANADIVSQLVADVADVGDAPITLLYAARDTNCNHAVVLRDFLLER
jgi:uncharacterized protein YeaO (DUF488 family)